MKVFGLGFPELAITSAVFAIPLVIGVLLIVALAHDIRALLKYLRSTDRQQSHLELTRRLAQSCCTSLLYIRNEFTPAAPLPHRRWYEHGRRPHPAFQPPP